MRRYYRRNLGDEAPIVPVEEEITSERWMMPSTTATQIFGIIPGIAGGLAGLILAQKLADYKKVSTTEVVLASGLVALITLGSIFLVKTVSD